MIEGGSLECAWYDVDVVHLNTDHGNSDRPVTGLRRLAWGKGVAEWKTIHRPQS